MKCKYCGSGNTVVLKCKCGIPCIIHCKSCKKSDRETLPHVRPKDRVV